MKKVVACVINVLLIIALGMQIVMAADEYLVGDIDGNGKVEASDALSILKMAVQLEPVKDIADVNEDQVVDASDALIVLKTTVELEPYTYIINEDLKIGEDYVVDGVYDKGTGIWKYETEETMGITVTKTIKELPENSAPGDTPEQVYTISVSEAGNFKFILKLVNVSDENTVLQQKNYIFNVD